MSTRSERLYTIKKDTSVRSYKHTWMGQPIILVNLTLIRDTIKELLISSNPNSFSLAENLISYFDYGTSINSYEILKALYK